MNVSGYPLKSAPSAPAAPDPTQTAQAQTASNQQTALYQAGLNDINQNTPLGNISYNINPAGNAGSFDSAAYNKAMDAYQQQLTAFNSNPQSSSVPLNGKGQPDIGMRNQSGSQAVAPVAPKMSDFQTGAATPSVTSNITLSPDQQTLYNQNTQQSIGLSNLASQLQDNVGTALKQPGASSADFATAEKQAQDAYYKQQTQYLDPQFAQAQEQLDAKNANQGITRGSEADNRDQLNLANQKQQAYSNAQENAILQGPQNAQQLFALSTAARDQPLQEFNALRSQSQVQMPSFNAAPSASVNPTNTAAITQQAYQNSLNPYNAQIAANNQTTGGLFGLGGSLASAAIMASDIRLKENIKYVGQEKGHKLYHFNYISDPEKIPYRGVMAHEVDMIDPSAVIKDGEYYKVNYAKLGIEFGKVH